MAFDGTSHSIRGLPSLESQIKLGYTIKRNVAHPFSLTLKDFRNLIVLGERAKDIYYLFLSQLCDQLQIPIVVLKEDKEDALENLICETPIWHLDVELNQITLNPVGFGDEATPIHARILASLLSDVYQLSPNAQKLLQMAIGNTILTSSTPSLQELRQRLLGHRAPKAAHKELGSLLEALDKARLFGSFDNISLGRFHSVPTILTVPKNTRGHLIANLLLLKLLACQGAALPPLVLFDPPLNPLLMELLARNYAVCGDFLLFLDSQGRLPKLDPLIPHNLVISALQATSPYYQELTDDEHRLLESHHDLVAIKLFETPTQIVNIF